jgi:hypothetical protein
MKLPKNAEERIKARFIPSIYKLYREVPGAVVYASEDHQHAIAFRGTALNHEWHFRFKNQQQLDRTCEELFDRVKAHQDYKAERKAKRVYEEPDTLKVKRALKSAGYAVTSVHHDTGTASNWIDITIDDYDEYIDTNGHKQRRYGEVMRIAKIASGRQDLHDDISTDYFEVNINVTFKKYHRCGECLISNCTDYHTPDTCARECFYSREMADWDQKRREKNQEKKEETRPAGYIPHLGVSIVEEVIIL